MSGFIPNTQTNRMFHAQKGYGSSIPKNSHACPIGGNLYNLG